MAESLGYSVDDVDEVRKLISNLRKSWLLILDNADDPDFDYQLYFPSGDWGTIIITSRVSDCSQYQTVGSETLAGLNKKECVELLLKVADTPLASWPAHERAAEIVINDLSSHTLAVIQAGAYIARGHCSMEEYPGKFRQQHAKLLEFRPKQAKSRYSDVLTTFEASASVLEDSESLEAKDALCLLEVLAMLHFSELPLQTFETAWKGSQEVRKINSNKNGAVDALVNWHISQLPGFVPAELDEWDAFRLQEASSLLASLFLIIKRKHDNQFGISMHSLVHAWARNRLASKQERGQAWKTTGSILALSFAGSEVWRRYYGRQLRPHVHSFLNVYTSERDLPDHISKIAPMLLKCAMFLDEIRDDKMLANLLKRVFDELRIDSKSPSIQSIYLLPLYDLQATNLELLGQAKYAVQLLEQLVRIRDTSLSEDHPDRLASQHELARAYQANGQIRQAVQLLEQVVRIRETTLNEDHPRRLASQHALACASQEMARSDSPCSCWSMFLR